MLGPDDRFSQVAGGRDLIAQRGDVRGRQDASNRRLDIEIAPYLPIASVGR